MKRSRKRSRSVPSNDAQKVRINRLHQQLKLPWVFPRGAGQGLDPDAEERLLTYLLSIEDNPATTTTGARQLISDGIELPPPDALRPEAVHAKLWEVLHGLARRRTFLQHTDHLSDLELYQTLWDVTLNEETEDLDESMGQCACTVDLLGSGSEESDRHYLQYFATDLEREEWQDEFPGAELPARCDPPHDRDRHLPRP